MAEQLDKKENVTVEEVVVSQSYEIAISAKFVRT
jgi:hypothetical protein